MSKLEQLIAKIEGAELGRHFYRDTNGCMCVVGHIFEDCGMLDKILESPFNNGKHLKAMTTPTGLYNKIRNEYGLNLSDLSNLQEINDNETDPDTRKKRVLEYLRLVGEIVG